MSLGSVPISQSERNKTPSGILTSPISCKILREFIGFEEEVSNIRILNTSLLHNPSGGVLIQFPNRHLFWYYSFINFFFFRKISDDISPRDNSTRIVHDRSSSLLFHSSLATPGRCRNGCCRVETTKYVSIPDTEILYMLMIKNINQ